MLRAPQPLSVSYCNKRIDNFQTDEWWQGVDTRIAREGYTFLKLLLAFDAG